MGTFTEVRLRSGESVWVDMSAEELKGLISLGKNGVSFDEVLDASRNFKDIEVKISEIESIVG